MSRKNIEYTDVGHKEDDSMLWVLDYRGHLDVRSIREGTHNSIWGVRAMGMWRGRFEPKTLRLSVVPPATYAGGDIVPQSLIDALEEKFGGSLELLSFNPSKRGAKKINRRTQR